MGAFGLTGYANIGAIKSIQSGTVQVTDTNTTATDTISTVTPNNCLLFATQDLRDGVVSFSNYACTWQITGATSLQITRGGSSGSSDTVRYTIIEFEDGIIDTVQNKVVSVSAGTSSGTVAITTVDTAKAWVIPSGARDSGGANLSTAGAMPSQMEAEFTSTTVLQASKSTGSSNLNMVYGYQVIEKI